MSLVALPLLQILHRILLLLISLQTALQKQIILFKKTVNNKESRSFYVKTKSQDHSMSREMASKWEVGVKRCQIHLTSKWKVSNLFCIKQRQQVHHMSSEKTSKSFTRDMESNTVHNKMQFINCQEKSVKFPIKRDHTISPAKVYLVYRDCNTMMRNQPYLVTVGRFVKDLIFIPNGNNQSVHWKLNLVWLPVCMDSKS